MASSLQDLIVSDRYLSQCRQLAHQAVLAGTLLESVYAMNSEPDEEAMELIAQKVSSTKMDVAYWFQLRRAIDQSAIEQPINYSMSSSPDHHLNRLYLNQIQQQAGQQQLPQQTATNSSKFHQSRQAQQASTTAASLSPNSDTNQNNSSTLLSKLSAVTQRLKPSQQVSSRLDANMIDLLSALYKINDNPEPAAIEMIARRCNVNKDHLAAWFDQRRLELNPLAGPRSPPIKKRDGGRVVTFSEYQRSLLEAIFDENNYLHPQEYEELSNLIQVPSRNIKIWFKNRRSKQRLSGRATAAPPPATE